MEYSHKNNNVVFRTVYLLVYCIQSIGMKKIMENHVIFITRFKKIAIVDTHSTQK